MRVVLFDVSHSKIPAIHNKDMKLSKLLDVVNSKVDASLHFIVSEVCVVNAGSAATDLLIDK